ncbi:MAG: RNA-binding transcriptional accessory protein, partial [Treponema sp.]|nr:RNA-binding transcriptional accessory protein [Treponema sp.]
MDLDKSFIESLQVNEVTLMKGIAEKLSIQTGQVSSVINLLTEGSTVPFIARYRKEKTGSLDEVQVRDIEHLFNGGKNLETRRIEIIRGIFGQGKLTEGIYENISKAATAAELEDIYAPYKRKKKTRGMIALERGLYPLAQAMKELETAALRAKAGEFLVPAAATETPQGETDLTVATVEDALQGAMDIIAEEVSQDTENRARVKSFYQKDGRIIVKASGKAGLGDEETKKTSTYQMYWDYQESLSRIKAHRILAINRGEREAVLEVTIDVDENAAAQMLQGNYELHNDYHKTAVEDGLKRLLSPAVIREIRGDQGEMADDHGISIFSENLKNLLMQQPIKGSRVLGIDPGIRTGTKCAFLDDTGKYLGNFVIYNNRIEESKKLLLQGIKQYDIQLIAVGNGTGGRDVQEIVSQVITDNNLEVLYTVVDEDGASVYSASDIAREEFPELDLTIRGAISIGRRLQDPLAELVKIDPKSIGVGLYQHDLNQKKLSETLDEVVASVVNNVGVNLNTASVSLLKYVSGINSTLAKKIVRYRDEKGRIENREELISVSGMGPKSYEQCAGFLKIPESPEPLDNTWVHPENYGVAREIRAMLGAGPGAVTAAVTLTGSLSSTTIAELKEKHGVGDATISDIVEELKKPNRDPREGHPKPVMQKGVVNFEDLTEGMTVTGKIKNVVDFGAFVDLGIKETALVHVSELSDRFIKDPLEVVKVGDVLDFKIISLDTDRRRIGLSRKSNSPGSGA